VVIPIAAYGIRYISRMQLATQPIWLVLQIAPLAYMRAAAITAGRLDSLYRLVGQQGWIHKSAAVRAAASILLSLLPQVCEQVDYLRFLPVTDI